MVTDSGKLLSAGLFACLLPPRLPNLPCGKALIKRSGVSSPETVDTIMFYKEPNNVWRQIGDEVWGCNKTIGGCEHGETLWILVIPLEEAIIAVQLQTHPPQHMVHHFGT